MQRNCIQCGKPFEGQRVTAKYCSATCRVYRSRSGPPPARPAVTVQVVSDRPVSGLFDSVHAELEVLGKVDTVDGQHALELANRIVSAPGMNTGVAALSKELSRVLGEVRGGSSAVLNPLDELKARRDAKRRAG